MFISPGLIFGVLRYVRKLTEQLNFVKLKLLRKFKDLMALNVHIKSLYLKTDILLSHLRLTLRRHLRLKCLPLISFLGLYRCIFIQESKKQGLQISQFMSKSKIKHIHIHTQKRKTKGCFEKRKVFTFYRKQHVQVQLS